MILEHLAKDICRVVYWRVKKRWGHMRPESQDEIAQNALLKLHKSPTVVGDRPTWPTYVSNAADYAAMNFVRDSERKKYTMVTSGLTEAGYLPDVSSEVWEIIPENKRTIVREYFNGHTYRSLADKYNTTHETMRQYIKGALNECV
jgi:DNA-directed RNA polymerase specialized sigma24 family protein